MKKILIPVAAAAVVALSPAHAQGVLGDKTKDKAPPVEVKKEGSAREIKTPVGTVGAEANRDVVGAGAALGTEKSPKVKAGARADLTQPQGVTANAGVSAPENTDDKSTKDRAKSAGDKLVPESAK